MNKEKLVEQFNNSIRADLKKTLNKKSLMAVPTIEKINVNMGIGRFKGEKEYIKSAMEDIAQITGLKPRIRKSRIAVSGFKLRKGDTVGVSATLRGEKMWSFLENLIRIVLPRVRDFRGLSKKSFDGKGNYSIGIREHVVFPTINANKVSKIKSLQVTIVTTAVNDEEGYILLKSLGLPFKKEGKNK